MAALKSIITEEFLTCSICFEIYKEPKTLQCLHSFCKNCIDCIAKKADGKAEHQCPLCREIFILPKGGAIDLKTNFYLKNLIEIVCSTKEVKKCSFCILNGGDIVASAQCLTCNDFLCPECADHRHRSTTITFHHRVVPLVEVMSGKHTDEIRSKQRITCSDHKTEDLRYFCETCDVPICRDCIVLGHKNHTCVTPSDAKAKMEATLNGLMSLCKKIMNGRTTEKDRLDFIINKLQDEKTQFDQNLETQTNSIIKRIIDSKKSVQKEFDKKMKAKQITVNQQKKSTERKLNILNQLFSFCENILNVGNELEILSMKSEIIEHLSKLETFRSEQHSPLDVPHLPTLIFNTNKGIFQLIMNNEHEKVEKTKQIQLAEKDRKIPKECLPLVLKTFPIKGEGDCLQPMYSSVGWITGDSIVVVDQRKEKLKVISWECKEIVSSVIRGCTLVNSFKNGIACQTSNSSMHVLNSSLEITKTISEVLILLTSHAKCKKVFWITRLKKICFLEKNDIIEIDIYDQNAASTISNPLFGHVLQNGMFAVSDCDQGCVFIIRNSGFIDRRKYCTADDSFPGCIASDSMNNIYVCDYVKSAVVVFDIYGVTLGLINVYEISPNPRSIAIYRDGQLLISNTKRIVLADIRK